MSLSYSSFRCRSHSRRLGTAHPSAQQKSLTRRLSCSKKGPGAGEPGCAVEALRCSALSAAEFKEHSLLNAILQHSRHLSRLWRDGRDTGPAALPHAGQFPGKGAYPQPSSTPSRSRREDVRELANTRRAISSCTSFMSRLACVSLADESRNTSRATDLARAAQARANLASSQPVICALDLLRTRIFSSAQRNSASSFEDAESNSW